MNYQIFLDNHLQLLSKGDAGRLVDNDYHDDAVMILMLGSEGQVVTGKAALKQQFGMYLEKVYRGFQSLEKIGFYEDSICLEATINTTEGVVRVWDALYMKDDKIYRHFSGVMQ